MYVKLVVSNCANDVAFELTSCERVPFGVKVSLFSVTTKLLLHAVIATLLVMTSIYRERRLSLASTPNGTLLHFSSTKPVTLK